MWPWWCVGWYDTVIVSCLVSNVHFSCIVQDSLYHTMGIGTMWHCALASCASLQSIGLFFGCALFWCWMSLCAHFTISSTEFYFIMIFIMIIVTITEIFMANLFILNYTFRLFVTIVLVLQKRNCLDVSAPGHSLWILDWICYLRTPLCHVYIPL